MSMAGAGKPKTKLKASIAERQRALQEIRALLADVDGSNVDLKQIRNERLAMKYERTQ